MADEVNVKITADTAGFKSDINSAAASAQQSFAQIKSAANGASVSFDQLGASARAQIAAAMGQVGSAAQTASAEVQTATAGMSHGIATAALNTGELREAFVLLHEAVTGRLNRIPGSLMVIAERAGSLSSIIGALASPWGAMAAAAAAALAVLGDVGYQAIEDANSLDQLHGSLVLMGRGLEISRDDLSQFRENLKETFDLSQSDARALAAAFGALPGVTLAEATALASMAVEASKAKGVKLDETIKQVAEAAQRGGTAIMDLGKSWGLNNDAATKNVETLDKAGRTSDALSAAIKAVTSAVEAQVGPWTRATAAANSYIAAVAALGEAGPALALGGAMPAPKSGLNVPSTPPATGPAQSVDALRKAQLDAATAADQHKAAIINLRTELDTTNSRSIAGLQKRIELTKQLAALEYPGSTATDAAERNRMIAEAQAREDNFKPPRGASGGAAKGGQADELETWREQLQQKLEAERNFFADSTAEELAFWKQKLALTQSGSKEQAQVQSTIYGLEKRQAEEGLRAAEESESRQESLDRTYLSSFEGAMKQLVALKKISLQQALGFDIQYTAQVEEQEKKRLQAFINDDRLSQAEKQQYYDRLLSLEADYDNKITGFQTQTANQANNAWKEAATQISDAFAKATTDIIERTKSIGQAFDELVSSLLKDTLESTLKSLFSQLIPGAGGSGTGLDLTKLLFGQGGLGSLFSGGGGGGSTSSGSEGGDQDFSGGASGGGSSIFGSLFSGLLQKGILGGAGSLLSGAGTAAEAGSVAAMWGGGGAADVAAGLTAGGSGGIMGGLGSLFSFLPALFAFEKGGIVPSAAGGWSVPQLGSGGTLAQLHSNEMVLPANISQGLQGMIANGGGGGHTFNMNISAMDGASVMSMGPKIVASINTAIRNGSMLRTT